MSKEERQEICEEMCDYYCRFPRELMNQSTLMTVCDDCPLNRLKEDGDEER